MANKSLSNYEYGGPTPSQFSYYSGCSSNQHARIMPYEDVCWKNVPMAPSTLKHLYDGPLNYPQRFQLKPQDTLYKHDFVQTHLTGLGKNKILAGGHYLTYPLTNRHVREVNDYTSYFFEKPRWTSQIYSPIYRFPNQID